MFQRFESLCCCGDLTQEEADDDDFACEKERIFESWILMIHKHPTAPTCFCPCIRVDGHWHTNSGEAEMIADSAMARALIGTGDRFSETKLFTAEQRVDNVGTIENRLPVTTTLAARDKGRKTLIDSAEAQCGELLSLNRRLRGWRALFLASPSQLRTTRDPTPVNLVFDSHTGQVTLCE
ncbi:hypothetical protein CC86DRAFT_89588 [Ophiobolus disseminans]|uniref:Uncharacterized protein n=1 Tax=Ophiobolus disseminans TaxID=1469910 RepID=A0A6A7AGT7_9PLEO|nr:hypothetical protein CC86DRAFT_89588 [Ophiobolus disseminans]